MLLSSQGKEMVIIPAARSEYLNKTYTYIFDGEIIIERENNMFSDQNLEKQMTHQYPINYSKSIL